jgi:hypothetical protein
MVKNFLFIILFVSLAACDAVQVKPITTPEGKQGSLVTCDGGYLDWASCYGEAAKICNGKYKVIDKNETSTATQWGPLVRRYMIIDCGG